MEHLFCNYKTNDKIIKNAFTSNGFMSFLPKDLNVLP